MVCCSIASCIEDLSSSDILSISSMHAIPPEASTKVPASRVHLPSPNSSLTAAAVSPAAEVDFPVAITPRGAILAADLSNCDFARPGSPIINMCMSPRILVPSGNSLSTPPNCCNAKALFSHSIP